MKTLNWQIIQSNINGARKELEGLESRIKSTDEPNEIELELALRHAFHHLNLAWNTRKITEKEYSEMNTTEFAKWGQFPEGMDNL